MTKKQEALNKAKESWKKVVEWWKELWTWSVQVIWWTTWALSYTLLSAWERENVRAWNHLKNAIKWTWKVLKWWSKIVRHSLKWGYHLIDAWDKAIWEQIEKWQLKKWKKTWKIWTLLRDNILKLMIALSATVYGWYKASELFTDKSKDKIEIFESLTEAQQFTKDFFASPDVMEHLKSLGKKREQKWEDRYLWKDEAWNNMRDGFWFAERKKVIEWMCRMIESWDLEMVLRKADEAWVPRQCVFLALAESWWQAWADSWVAWWYWQFTKGTAKLYWLIDEEWNDYRSDPEKSTDAAMQHLKDNYKIVCNYAKELWYEISESDKWIFAFHMYNWSPKLVKKWIIACEWKANNYSERQINWENRNYVPRILAIQNALEKIFKENWYDTQKIRSVHLNQEIKKTEADLMYEEFIKLEKTLSQEQREQKLNEVKIQYEKEYKEWLISEVYYKWAVRVIDEAMISEDREEEKDD